MFVLVNVPGYTWIYDLLGTIHFISIIGNAFVVLVMVAGYKKMLKLRYLTLMVHLAVGNIVLGAGFLMILGSSRGWLSSRICATAKATFLTGGGMAHKLLALVAVERCFVILYGQAIPRRGWLIMWFSALALDVVFFACMTAAQNGLMQKGQADKKFCDIELGTKTVNVPVAFNLMATLVALATALIMYALVMRKMRLAEKALARSLHVFTIGEPALLCRPSGHALTRAVRRVILVTSFHVALSTPILIYGVHNMATEKRHDEWVWFTTILGNVAPVADLIFIIIDTNFKSLFYQFFTRASKLAASPRFR